jgi:hypothetical protein
MSVVLPQPLQPLIPRIFIISIDGDPFDARLAGFSLDAARYRLVLNLNEHHQTLLELLGEAYEAFIFLKTR